MPLRNIRVLGGVSIAFIFIAGCQTMPSVASIKYTDLSCRQLNTEKQTTLLKLDNYSKKNRSEVVRYYNDLTNLDGFERNVLNGTAVTSGFFKQTYDETQNNLDLIETEINTKACL